jgi:hypothetical protein
MNIGDHYRITTSGTIAIVHTIPDSGLVAEPALPSEPLHEQHQHHQHDQQRPRHRYEPPRQAQQKKPRPRIPGALRLPQSSHEQSVTARPDKRRPSANGSRRARGGLACATKCAKIGKLPRQSLAELLDTATIAAFDTADRL